MKRRAPQQSASPCSRPATTRSPRFYRRKTLRSGLELRQGPRRDRARDDRPPPEGKTPRRRAVPDADRVLGLPGRRPRRPAHDDRRQPRATRCSRPASTAVGSLIAPLLGYAAVGVQMRGSGCSGGAFGLFDLPTTADGYDAVETVAAQDWVKGGKVGMVGITFSGITPALHRRHAAAAPRRDRADVGHRRPLTRHGLPRRHPEQRLRPHLDPGADGRRGARSEGRPALGPRARRGRATATASRTSACASRRRTRSR